MDGTFREDLYYRLNVLTLQLPRLSERKEDLPLLISSFIEKYNRPFGKKIRHISSQAIEILRQYNYPGNVRELENIIQRAIALTEGDTIKVENLPPDLQNLDINMIDGDGLLTLEEVEKQHITRVLQKTGNNKILAGRILDLPRTTLWRKLKKFGLLQDD